MRSAGRRFRWFGLLVVLAWLPARAQVHDPSMGMGNTSQHSSQRSTEDILPDVADAIAGDPAKVMERADKAFENSDWLEAVAHYQHVRNRFSYNVALAARAELRLADIAFAREKWGEARSQYRTFARMHPGHAEADYAAWRAGLSTWKDLPDGGWITPPAEEKDQSQVLEALKQMREFIRSYPASKHLDEAKKTAVDCQNRLAAHELYVADYYARRGKWRGTLLRAEGVVRAYPESDRVPEALAWCVEAHAALKEADQARKAFEDLSGRKPDKSVMSRAEKALRQL